MLVTSVISSAQNKVSGTVTDAATGETVVGVTVLVKGTTKGESILKPMDYPRIL